MSWLAFRLFLADIPAKAWAVLAALALLVAVGLFARSHYIGVGEDRVQARWDAQEAVYAEQRRAAAEAARKTEERHRAEYRAIADRFLAQQKEADEEHAATVAALRAGAIRVRPRFQCPANPGTPADPARTAQEGRAGLLPQDAEFLLREAARADEVARQLNALIQAVGAGRSD